MLRRINFITFPLFPLPQQYRHTVGQQNSSRYSYVVVQQLVPEVKMRELIEPPPTPPGCTVIPSGSWLHGNSVRIDPFLRTVVAFFKRGRMKVLSPLLSMISCRMLWRVVHTALSFCDVWASMAVLG